MSLLFSPRHAAQVLVKCCNRCFLLEIRVTQLAAKRICLSDRCHHPCFRLCCQRLLDRNILCHDRLCNYKWLSGTGEWVPWQSLHLLDNRPACIFFRSMPTFHQACLTSWYVSVCVAIGLMMCVWVAMGLMMSAYVAMRLMMSVWGNGIDVCVCGNGIDDDVCVWQWD